MYRLLSVFIAIFVLTVIFSGCKSDITQITGSIENGEFSDVTLLFPRLHYKYTPEDAIYLTTDNNGRFNFTFDIKEPTVLYLEAFSERYPIYIEPGKAVNIKINRNFFPNDVVVQGFGSEVNNRYQTFISEISPMKRHIVDERRKMLRNETHELFNVHRVRIQSAKEYLSGTPLEYYVDKFIGDYLVHRLEEVGTNKNNPYYNAEKARSHILSEAKYNDFFTLRSLKAQRAGIRDFADAWVKTFGIQNRLENELQQSLTENDWKQLGYEKANKARLQIINHISEKEALAHAQMYLNAERIAEAPFEYAIDELILFNKTYYDFPQYIDFLNSLYSQVDRVQPGKKAIDFELTDINGNKITLTDFKGKFVLLDFWTSWCTPCLVEFPYMEEIYEAHSKYDLEIISISIDENKEDWISATQRFDHPWIQTYAEGGFSNELFNAYRAGGIPYYILIDRNGYILSNNTIRPSFNLISSFENFLINEYDHTYVSH